MFGEDPGDPGHAPPPDPPPRPGAGRGIDPTARPPPPLSPRAGRRPAEGRRRPFGPVGRRRGAPAAPRPGDRRLLGPPLPAAGRRRVGRRTGARARARFFPLSAAPPRPPPPRSWP